MSSIPIYFSDKYLDIQGLENLKSFRFEHVEGQFITHFAVRDGKAISLPNSPFGSYYFNGNFEKNILSDRLEKVFNELRRDGIREVEITHPVSIYNDFPPIAFFNHHGFEICQKNINQHISLEKSRTIHSMEQRKLKKLQFDNYKFEKAGFHELESLYFLLARAREAQGLEINISLSKLIQLFKAFPKHYLAWKATKNDKSAAVVILVRVTNDIMYYYLPGTDSNFKKESPMVGLMDAIISDLKRMKVKYFDLGVSSVDGEIQKGLHTFKKRMAAEDLPKYTFKKVL